MRCLRCSKQIPIQTKTCSCGFSFENNPIWSIAPIPSSIIYEINTVVSADNVKKRLGGWGPKRPTYTMNSPAKHAVFNSITDNSFLGDERDFVRIVETGVGKTFSSDITIEANKQYKVYIYYHNDASETYNDREHGQVGVALETRVATDFPDKLKKGERGAVVGIIRAVNTDPPAVWDSAYITAEEDMTLHYIEGSAKIYNHWNKTGTMLSTRIFSPQGTFIGLSQMNGIIFGCDKFSGSVCYTIQTKAARIDRKREE